MTKFAKPWLAVAVLCIAFPLQAASDLYSAQVTVEDQSPEVREDALQKALGRVIVRASGDPDAAISSAGREVTARARQLVQQFGYKRVPLSEADEEDAQENNRPDRNAAEEEEPKTKLLLRVRFNAGAVNSALRRAGLPVWGSERPKTMLWLAQSNGGSPSIINGAQARPLQKTAQARGVPIVFPRQDTSERQRANAADVIAGYNERLRAVTRSYGANHLVVGTIKNSGGLWEGRIALMQGDETLDEWQASASSQQQLLNDVMRRVANDYARRYSVSANSVGNSVVVAIDRVDSVQAYARVSNFLADLTAVDSVVPAMVNQDYVVFAVKLSGDVDVLRRGIGLADWLTEDATVRDLAGPYSADGVTVGYRLSQF